MTVARRRPPFYWLIVALIGRPPASTVFTYGGTIYSPDSDFIPDDLAEHERTHRIQQGRAPWLWWARYLVDRGFRLRQEIAAYRAQVRWLRAHGVPAQYATSRMARSLSGPMYGRVIGYLAAKAAIGDD